MRKLLLLLLSLTAFNTVAQNMGVNATGATPNASSILDLNTGNTFTSPNGKGLLIPNVALTNVLDAVTVTSPAVSLVVYNTATAGTTPNNVTPGYYYWDGTKWVRLTTSIGGVSGNAWDVMGNAGTTPAANFLGTTDAQDLVIKTNNLEAVRVNTVGNVGIGTTGLLNPDVKLEVVSTNTLNAASMLRLSRNVGATPGFIDFFSNALAGQWNGLVSNGDKSIIFNNDNDPSVDAPTGLVIAPWCGLTNPTGGLKGLKIMENGNVGIGTNNPIVKLDVLNGDVRASKSSSLTESYLRDDGGVELFRSVTSASNQFNGYVDFKSNNTYDYNARLTFDHTIGATGAFAILTSTPGMVASTDYRMVVDNATGNVGIGTTTPQERLDVNTGKIRFFNGGTVNWNIGMTNVPNPGFAFTNVGNNEVKFFLQSIGGTATSARVMLDNDHTTDTEPMYGFLNDVNTGISGGQGDQNFIKIITDGTEKMRVIQNGNVGIGTITPTFKLEVNGTTACTGNVWTSDRRKKQNIQALTINALDVIKKLNPVTYSWIDVKDAGMKGQQIGFIAQELEEVLPNVVVTSDNDEKSKGVKYIELIPVITKAMQEQQIQIQELKQQNETLLKRIETLEKK
jgi:Chaperone of endosialidase